MFETLSAQIGAAVMLAVAAFVFAKGDKPERIGIGVYLLAWLASLLFQTRFNYDEFPWPMFASDVIVLIVFYALAWKSTRTWPAWASGFQLRIVMSHVARMANLDTPTSVVMTVLNLAGYSILAAIAIGAFWAWQERRAAGLD